MARAGFSLKNRLNAIPSQEAAENPAPALAMPIPCAPHLTQEEAFHAARIQARIFQVQKEIASANLDLQAVMNLMAQRAQELTSATGAAIELLDEQENVLHSVAGTSESQIGLRMRLEASLSGSVVKSGTTFYCMDAQAAPGADQLAVRKVGARAVIIAPLRSSTQVIGVLKVVSDRPRAFGPQDVDNVEILVESLGAVIERHRTAERLRASEEQYRMLFDHNPHPMWVYDRQSLRVLAVNRAAILHYGYSEQEFLGLTIRDLTPPEDIARMEQAVLSLGQSTKGIWCHRKKDGSLIDVEIASHPIDFNGRPARMVLLIDMTQQLAAERELIRVSRAQRMSRACSEALIRADDEEVLLREVCRIAVEIGGYSMAWVGFARDDETRSIVPVASFGRDAHSVDGLRVSWLDQAPAGRGPAGAALHRGEVRILPDFGADADFQPWYEAAMEHGFRGGVCLPLRSRERTFGVFNLYASEVADISADELSLLQALADDLTFGINNLHLRAERQAAEREIRQLAYFDPLTRLPNRIRLLERLKEALAANAASQREGALLFIDLDNFKTLNDTLGHDQGDRLLQQVGMRLAECVRDSDLVARLGGDEFVVLLENLAPDSDQATRAARAVGGKILAALNQPFRLAGYETHSTPSIGITLFAGHQDDVGELLKRADLAMYQAKAAGRNTMRFFDPRMQAAISDRAALESDLRQGMQRNEFLLEYQPQVDGNGRVIGAEVLLRWDQLQRGLVAPADFIPLAEESGLIVPLGLWVLETACRQLVAWNQKPQSAGLTLAVNVSARQFRHPDFVEQVLTVLERTGVDPGRLKLELTESLLVDNMEDTIARMNALQARGVGFSLDDFGTGYSSLAYLKRLPLDQLKIDQSFVRDVLTDPNDAVIARTIVALGQSLGLSVIAEGVECEAQRDFLACNGCHAYQGYLFSRPLPAEQFERLLEGKVAT
jgi:diguanylate cyclase (GGDEF)-like protein/PAS domain S-box-containing protein